MRIGWFILFAASTVVYAQEASSGFELRTTLSASLFNSQELPQYPRDGSETSGGFRAMLYPTWKLNQHWTLSGVVQVHSRPYFEEEFSTQGYGVNANVIQLNLSYARFWSGNRSLVVRVGQLSSAFGSFIQRYDAADNPVIQIPSTYGYYYGEATLLGLAGAQVDATAGKFDARLQFANSSPANPQSIFSRDQYGSWVGGVGYTILQGLRVGGSAFYGPYLDRDDPYYFRGDVRLRTLPATGLGLDAEWGWGHWNAWGEVQHFQLDYGPIPNLVENAGYAEIRRVLTPRWYAAGRFGYQHHNLFPGKQTYEFAAGFRANAHQLIKLGYLVQQGTDYPGTLGNVAQIEFVTTFRPISLAKD